MSTKWAKTFRTQIVQSQFIHEELKKLSDPAAAVLFGSKVILFIVWRKGEHRSQISFWEKFIFVGLIKSKKRSSVSFSSLSSIRIEKFESSQSQLWLSGPFLPSAQTFPSRCLRGSWNFHFAPFSKKKKSNHFSHMFLIKRLSSLSSWRARDFFNNFIQKGTFLCHLLWTLAYPDAIPKH